MVFLATMGILFQFQPDFIDFPVEFDSSEEFYEQAEIAQWNAYGGAITYLVITVLCVASYHFHVYKEGGFKKTKSNEPNQGIAGNQEELEINKAFKAHELPVSALLASLLRISFGLLC